MFFGGGRLNSPFPRGVLKVAVSGRCEGRGQGGRYESAVLKSPSHDLTNSPGSFQSWQELKLCCSVSPLATVKCWREDSGQHEPCWLLDQIYNAAIQVAATGLQFLLSFVTSSEFDTEGYILNQSDIITLLQHCSRN